MSQQARIHTLTHGSLDLSKPFLSYWCLLSLRTHYNHSLEYAIHIANKHTIPLIVFTTTNITQSHTARNIQFELQSLQSLSSSLALRDIKCIHLFCCPIAGAIFMAKQSVALVVDKPYLRTQRTYYTTMLSQIPCPVIQVESNVVVPIHVTSDKAEYGAYTIRPKIKKHINTFLIPINNIPIENPSLHFSHNHLHFPKKQSVQNKQYTIYEINANTLNQETVKSLCDINTALPPTSIQGGQESAYHTLDTFLQQRITHYHTLRNDPSANNAQGYQSMLSPYLHKGCISPIAILLKIKTYIEQYLYEHPDDTITIQALQDSYQSFFEELVVRRELAYNFTYYTTHYDTIESIPNWATETLEEHKDDKRTIEYTPEQMENATTDDVYWNTAQLQLINQGYIHGYMRMYWGKKILEWSSNVAHAYQFTVDMNDTYALDGTNPNGYAGISWCYGTHDRPHPERPIFGKIRYMNANGLRRKFDIESYVQYWANKSK